MGYWLPSSAMELTLNNGFLGGYVTSVRGRLMVFLGSIYSYQQIFNPQGAIGLVEVFRIKI